LLLALTNIQPKARKWARIEEKNNNQKTTHTHKKKEKETNKHKTKNKSIPDDLSV